MLNNLFELANSLGDRWAAWMVAAILDSVALLAIISLVWLAIRRRVAPQLGYLLFLLVPLRLLSPFEVGVPPSVAKWTPSHLLDSWLTRPHSVASDHLRPATENSVVPDGNEVPNGSPLGSRQLTDGASASLETVAGTRNTSATISAAMLEPAAANVKMQLPAIGLAAWLAIVCLLTVRFIRTQLSFRKHLRATSPFDLSRLRVDFRAECDRAGIRRPVRLVESDCVMAPAAWGIVRPIVILPREITSILTADQLKWVLLHELAHIRRNDLLVIAAQRIVAILNFCNPAIWIANRVANRLREYACDDFATSLGEGSGVESGEAFVQILRNERRAHHKLEGAMGIFGLDSRAACLHRVERMLDLERPIRTRLGWPSLAGVFVLAVLGLPHLRADSPTTKSVSHEADIPKTLPQGNAEPKPKPPIANGETQETVPLTLAGHAKDPDGKPVVGATINLCMGQNQNSIVAATTNSGNDGSYLFKIQLPVSPASGSRERLLAGGFSLFGTAPGYGFAWSGSRDYWHKDKPVDAGVVPGDERTRSGHIDVYRNEPAVVDLDFTVAASLKGQVIDEDKRPIVGAKVWLWSADYLNGEGKAFHVNYREFTGLRDLLDSKYLIAYSGSDGHFEISGLPAEVCFGVNVESKGFGNASFHAATTSRPITVHRFNNSGTTIQGGIQVEVAIPGSHEVRTGDLTILLHPVRNVLIDVVEEDTGRPAADVRVGTNNLLGNGPSADEKTDRDGRAVLKLPMGQYRLTADPPRDSLYVRTRAALDGTAGRDKEPFRIPLTKGCVVNFEAIDADSEQGVTGIGFQAEDLGVKENVRQSRRVQSSTTYIDNPTTDTNGRMRAVMPPGNYQLSTVGQWLGTRNLSEEYESSRTPSAVQLTSGGTVEVKFRVKRKPSATKESPKPAPAGGKAQSSEKPDMKPAARGGQTASSGVEMKTPSVAETLPYDELVRIEKRVLEDRQRIKSGHVVVSVLDINRHAGNSLKSYEIFFDGDKSRADLRVAGVLDLQHIRAGDVLIRHFPRSESNKVQVIELKSRTNSVIEIPDPRRLGLINWVFDSMNQFEFDQYLLHTGRVDVHIEAAVRGGDSVWVVTCRPKKDSASKIEYWLAREKGNLPIFISVTFGDAENRHTQSIDVTLAKYPGGDIWFPKKVRLRDLHGDSVQSEETVTVEKAEFGRAIDQSVFDLAGLGQK